MDPEKQKLISIAKHVHSVLRNLKMGEIGTIPCSKEYPTEEVRSYATAYAFHKRKWFKLKHDPVSNIIYAERAPPPPWERPPEDSEPEEL
jgi:hypothetical protein